MKWNPILPLWVLLPVSAVFLGAAIGILLRRKTEKPGTRLLSFVRLFLIAVLALIVGARPMTENHTAEIKLSNLDVLFVIDNTISMYATDYHGRERMSGVIADAEYIMDRLAGANFALETFDDRSHVLAPFTQDAGHIRTLLGLLEMPYSYDAKGTDMNRPETDLESLLTSSGRKEGRRTILFFFGDGEITNGDGMESYADLAHFLSEGAVLGYGTEEGGTMRSTYGTYLYDYETHRNAVSRIDEATLKQLASDLGISYVHMSSQFQVDPILSRIEAISGSVTQTRMDIRNYDDIYFYFAIPLVLLLAWELVIFLRKGRL